MKTRHLYIKAIATTEFKKYYQKNWQETIKKTIQETSEIFEKEFGIKLAFKEIEIRDYKPTIPAFYYLFDYINNLANKDDLNKFDITIAFTNAPFFYAGIDSEKKLATLMSTMPTYSENFILLTNPEKTKNCIEYYKSANWLLLIFLLIHEIGHAFRAKDVKNEKSFMSDTTTPKSQFFNKANRKRILKNKWKKFR